MNKEEPNEKFEIFKNKIKRKEYLQTEYFKLFFEYFSKEEFEILIENKNNLIELIILSLSNSGHISMFNGKAANLFEAYVKAFSSIKKNVSVEDFRNYLTYSNLEKLSEKTNLNNGLNLFLKNHYKGRSEVHIIEFFYFNVKQLVKGLDLIIEYCDYNSFEKEKDISVEIFKDKISNF